MVKLPPHARGREAAPGPTRELPEPLSTVETWRRSFGTVRASPILLATVCLVAGTVGSLAAFTRHPVVLFAILVGYVVQTAVASATVADHDGNTSRPSDVLHLATDRLGAVSLTALVLGVCLTVVLEAVVHVLGMVVHPLVFVQAVALVTLASFVLVAFAGPAAVVDRQAPVHAILDGGLLTSAAASDLLALHLTFLVFVAPGAVAVLAGQSAVAVAVGAATICVWTGLLATALARTYEVAKGRQELAQHDRTPAWKLEGAPAGRK